MTAEEIVEWQPTCDCGWEGEWMVGRQAGRQAAYDAQRAHVKEAHPERREFVYERSRQRKRY